MCTAISYQNRLFGRTYDYHKSFGEKLLISPQKCIRVGEGGNRYAILGVGVEVDGMPLYFDGMNEHGLFAAALNFRRYAVYGKLECDRPAISSSHMISHILGSCRSVEQVREAMKDVIITAEEPSDGIKPTELHWIVCDRCESIVIESVREGVKIYDNPFGVLTNSPDFPFFLTRMEDFASLSPGNGEKSLFDFGNKPYSHSMGALGLPGDFSSVSRFVRTCFAKKFTRSVDFSNLVSAEMNFDEECKGMVSLRTNTAELCAFFSIMASVAVPIGCSLGESNMPMLTFYTVCADPVELCYYFTDYGCSEVRRVDLSKEFIDGERIISYPLYSKPKVARLN